MALRGRRATAGAARRRNGRAPRAGPTRTSRTSSGVVCARSDVMKEFTREDLPAPVAPHQEVRHLGEVDHPGAAVDVLPERDLQGCWLAWRPTSAGRHRASRSRDGCWGPRCRSPTCRGSAAGSARRAWPASVGDVAGQPEDLVHLGPRGHGDLVHRDGRPSVRADHARRRRTSGASVEGRERVALGPRVGVRRRSGPEQIQGR